MTAVAGKRGGARPGAGRKPKPPAEAVGRDPNEFLLDVMQGLVVPSPDQLKAAIAAAKIMATGQGKKGAQKQAAAQVAGGKFGPSAPPKLAVVGGR